MRPSILVIALFLSTATAAFAGGPHARIEGPAPGGTTYTMRAVDCDAHTSLEPWAIAEGVVDGHRQSVLLRLEPTSEHGVYRFERRWSQDGRWVIRLLLGHPSSPATVATLGPDGSVERNRLYRHTDGSRECSRALNPRGAPAGEDC